MTPNMTNNFHENVIELKSGDILFFDTNVLMALIFEENDYHLAVKHFIVHAIAHDCEMYISSTIYRELLHVVARELYCQHCVSTGERTAKSAKSNWPNLPKNRNFATRDLVRHFNASAIEKIMPLLSIFEFIDSTKEVTESAFDFSSKYNLHSADAFIASYTYKLGGSLVSLDKDLSFVTEFNTYTALTDASKPFNDDLYANVESHDELFELVTDLLIHEV